MKSRILAGAAFAGALCTSAVCAQADDSTLVRLTLKDHKFVPAEVGAPADKPLTLEIRNADLTPAEFESKTLRVEKAIAAGGTVTLQVRALSPGRYRFFDDYHADSAEGFLTVK